MDFPKLEKNANKTHWYNSDEFKGGKNEYIKFLVHNNYSIGYHTHSFYELNIVLEGEGYHYIDERPCEAKPGSVFLIPPYIQHGYINKRGMNVYHMLIHRSFLDNFFSEFKQTEGFYLLFETEPFLRAHYHKNIFLVLNDEQIKNILYDTKMMREYSEMQNSHIYINAIAKKILCELCAMMSRKFGVEQNHLSVKKEILGIVDCLNYIHRNFDEKLTVDALSKKLNMSRSTFIRQFTKICGTSPHKYIQSYRIKRADEYLRENGKASTKVAQECGFYDVSHMRKYLNIERE